MVVDLHISLTHHASYSGAQLRPETSCQTHLASQSDFFGRKKARVVVKTRSIVELRLLYSESGNTTSCGRTKDPATGH